MKRNIILACLLAAAMCACTNDDNLEGTTTDATALKAPVYMQFSISLPTDGTRSATDTDEGNDDYVTSTGGIEYGKTSENTIGSLLVVLVDESTEGQYKVVASVEAGAGELTKVDETTYVVEFEGNALNGYESKNLGVYVYCNPAATTQAAVISNGELQVDAAYSLKSEDDETPWTSNGFFMSNAKAHTATMPSDFKYYNTTDNPIDLGVVKVERSVARFDIKDGAADPADAPFTYSVGSIYDSESGETETGVTIVLQDVALVNMSKEFYYLRRVAANAAGSDLVADYTNPTLLGLETTNNWVVDTDAGDKIAYDGSADLTSNFLYPLFTSTTSEGTVSDDLNWEPLTGIVGVNGDTDDTWNSGNTAGDYYIWRYATENTIPSVAAQKNGISTGIAFRGEIKLGDTTVSEGDVIYSYENVLYTSWEDIATLASAGEESSTLGVAYQEVMQVWKDGKSETDDDVIAAMGEAGFTRYVAEQGNDENYHYYVYYYYWNRHNDNSENYMGPMEFGVVRNNVYKLSVTEINHLGFATPVPTDDDETSEYLFKLDVVILPWVVRLNNIEF